MFFKIQKAFIVTSDKSDNKSDLALQNIRSNFEKIFSRRLYYY